MPSSRPTFGKPCQRSDMVTIHAGGHSATVNQKVAGTLESLAKQFNQNVEHINSFGGYNCRNIAGSGTWSNHAWGLAVDINASQHPQGQHGTFSAKQVRAIRAILQKFPHIRWGGDYNSTVDEMHFEWMGDASQGSAAKGGDSGIAGIFGPIGEFFAFITDYDNIIRAGQVVGGALLLIIGFAILILEKPFSSVMGILGEGAKKKLEDK